MRKTVFALMFAMSAATLMAGAGGLLVKGVVKSWDEIAKVCLRASGRGTSKASVDAAAKALSDAAAKYGDDVARASMKGGIEVAEQTLRHGDAFVSLLRRSASISPSAIRLTATHTDEILRLTTRYGDDVLRVGAKAQGQIGPLVRTLEANKLPVQESLKMLNGLNAEELPRVIGALGRAESPAAASAFLEATKRGGSKFLDKLFGLSGTQILAGGLSAAIITAAVQAIEPPSKRTEAQTQWAVETLDNPEATPENREIAQGILKGNTETSVENSLVHQLKWPLLLIAAAIAVALLLRCWFTKPKPAPSPVVVIQQPPMPPTNPNTVPTENQIAKSLDDQSTV